MKSEKDANWIDSPMVESFLPRSIVSADRDACVPPPAHWRKKVTMSLVMLRTESASDVAQHWQRRGEGDDVQDPDDPFSRQKKALLDPEMLLELVQTEITRRQEETRAGEKDDLLSDERAEDVGGGMVGRSSSKTSGEGWGTEREKRSVSRTRRAENYKDPPKRPIMRGSIHFFPCRTRSAREYESSIEHAPSVPDKDSRNTASRPRKA